LPGLNNVIGSAVLEFYYNYGVQKVSGIRYGSAGLNPKVAIVLALFTRAKVCDGEVVLPPRRDNFYKS